MWYQSQYSQKQQKQSSTRAGKTQSTSWASFHKKNFLIVSRITPYSPFGIRLLSRNQLEQMQIYKNGEVEVQDEGSQLITLLMEAQGGQYVIDLCAGSIELLLITLKEAEERH